MDVHCDEGDIVVFPPTMEADEEGGELMGIRSWWTEGWKRIITHLSNLDQTLNLPVDVLRPPLLHLLHRPHLPVLRAAFAIHSAKGARPEGPEPIPSPVIGCEVRAVGVVHVGSAVC